MDRWKSARADVRQALVERQPRSKPQPAPAKATDSPAISSPHMPHHESLKQDVNPSVKERAAQADRAENRRISAVIESDTASNKRDSQVSTTSTNSGAKAKKKTHIGPWQLGKTLGKGATGRVRLAKHSLTGQTAAIKIVSKKSAAMVQSASMAQMDKEATTSADGLRTIPFGIEREVVIMKLIEHPHIINLYDIWENRGELYLVLEYVQGGELFDYVSMNGALPEHEAVRLLRQIISGLSYCHRFNICHRDLKPENILLDGERNIKLADFGMAALQPANHWLTTSCGSPHYAAPEIIQGIQYRGSKADIWSVGIILFAMLNGFLPFDGEDVSATLRLVRKGDYFLSPSLSAEASDLIQRILQKRPEKRISMEDIWRHPLLTKWEAYHTSTAGAAKLAGPPPPIINNDCRRQMRHDEIDTDILRNLQTLWHGEKQDALVKRLTNDVPNHEKLFYWALHKFRDEQLENYSGDSLQHSNSDYHHASKSAPHRYPKSIAHTRRPSQFSIVSESDRKRESYYKNPTTAASKTTQGSYDPYRASRTPIVDAANSGTVVVRHTDGYRTRTASNAASLRHPAFSRLQGQTPNAPSLDAENLEKLMGSNRYSYSTATSRSSLTSSRRGGIRKSTSYKRRVSFQHKRQPSIRTMAQPQLTAHEHAASNSTVVSRPVTQSSNQGFSDSHSTPSLPTPPHLAQPRFAASELNLKKPRVASGYWKEDTRKVSVELGKICEEAFNRSSVSSTSDGPQYPIGSSIPSLSTTNITVPSAIKNRPLPQTPALRDLLERRQKIVDSWGDADPDVLAEVMSTLDRRIAEERQKSNEIRAASDPTHSVRHRSAYLLPQISTTDDPSRHQVYTRAASDPTKVAPNRHDTTIRLVSPDPSSPGLRLELSYGRRNKAVFINSLRDGPNLPCNGRHDDNAEACTPNRPMLDTIVENPGSPSKRSPIDDVVTRKWSWLGRKVIGSQEELAPTPPRKHVTDSVREEMSSSASANSSGPAASENDDIDQTVAKKRKWFQKMFNKTGKKDERTPRGQHEVIDNDPDDADSLELHSTPYRAAGRQSRGTYPPVTGIRAATASAASKPIEIQQNWFAKLFHVKPATRILVLQMSKVKARKELLQILKEWRKYGIRDVHVYMRDIIRGRVDAANYLHIKPVHFHGHVYTVLERGRRVSLSVVKFVQEKGAASSFYRVVDTLESIMHENDYLLADVHRKKGILQSMKEAGL